LGVHYLSFIHGKYEEWWGRKDLNPRHLGFSAPETLHPPEGQSSLL
jgi:hypothetical protein